MRRVFPLLISWCMTCDRELLCSFTTHTWIYIYIYHQQRKRKRNRETEIEKESVRAILNKSAHCMQQHSFARPTNNSYLQASSFTGSQISNKTRLVSMIHTPMYIYALPNYLTLVLYCPYREIVVTICSQILLAPLFLSPFPIFLSLICLVTAI